jgi:hypothetical protein
MLSTGTLVSTVKVRWEMSVVRAASVALTAKVCLLSESLGVVFGELQDENGAPSMRQRKLESESREEKTKLGVGSLVNEPASGPAMIETSAGPATVQVREATATFWTVSLALTSNVCDPSARREALNGERQASKPPPSRRHLKTALGSLESKANEGLRSREVKPSAGPEENVTTGGVVSTVQLREATSAFWARSIALTWNV